MVGFGDLWVCCCGLLEDLWLAVGCCGRRIVVAGGVCGGLAVMVLISGGFFVLFYVAPNTVKYLLDHFPKCKQTLEKQSFSLKSFAFANILR